MDFRPATQRKIGNFTTPAASTISGAARVPSTVRPVNLVTSVDITVTSGQNRVVALEVETGPATGVYVAVGRWRNSATIIGITSVVGSTVSITIPTGCGYRYTQTGTGTAAIASQLEQLA